MLFQHIAKEQDPCLQCADQNTDNCPGPNLCGKTVLYVGGLHKMVPHYRQLVEQFGGRFLHHDGGKEASSCPAASRSSTALLSSPTHGWLLCTRSETWWTMVWMDPCLSSSGDGSVAL